MLSVKFFEHVTVIGYAPDFSIAFTVNNTPVAALTPDGGCYRVSVDYLSAGAMSDISRWLEGREVEERSPGELQKLALHGPGALRSTGRRADL